MLELSRRSVMAFGAGTIGAIAIGALTTPAAATGLAGAATLPSFTPAPASALPVRSHFAGHEGETFVATSTAGAIALTLTAINDVPPAIGTDDENRFNLIFTAQGSTGQSPTARLAQATYTFTHPTVPEATFFSSPVGPTELRQLQALVNRSA